MKNSFKIFNKKINHNSPSLIIAEIGINHLGDVSLCEEMILAALESGADCVKLQTTNATESYHPESESYSVFKGTEFNRDQLYYLTKITEKNNGFLFSTPGDFTSLELLESINIKAYKVSSGLFKNIPLIKEIAKTNKPIIFSTGMAKEIEISRIMQLLSDYDKQKISLLHCTSIYPAPIDTLNLTYINNMKEKYNIIVGYSDHSNGDLACLSAIAMGAKIIEKHFTIDNKINGADNAMSMHHKDFKIMCTKIREVEEMMNGSNLKPHPEELVNRDLRYRKIVAKENILIGDEINLKNVNFMRLASKVKCIDACDWNLVSGKKSKKEIKKFDPITFESI
jgi:sialic acid synthase SpsE